MRSDREYLQDIVEAISGIEKYAALGRARFGADELIHTFVIHKIMIIGEAATSMTQACRDRAPEVVWADVIGMRNRLIHGYFKLNLEVVWKTIEQDLPPLKSSIQRLLADPGPSQTPT